MNEKKNLIKDVAGCPIRSVLAVLAAKWPMLVVNALSDGRPMFFGELGRAIPDVSPRMLSQALKMLMNEELVTRTVIPEIPPRTQYQLTAYGETLLEAMNPLINWALAHLKKSRPCAQSSEDLLIK